MQADFKQIDVISTPLLSSVDFENRIKSWLKEVDESVGRDKALVVYFGKVKEDLGKMGVEYDPVVAATCRR